MKKFLICTLTALIAVCQADQAFSDPGILEKTQALTAKATKAEDLYQVRILLKRAAAGDNHTTAELQELAESFRILSGGFARFSHYKNSVEAYTNYLQYTEKLIDKTRLAQLDSMQQAHVRQEKAELDEISVLKSGMNDLAARQTSLSGYRSNYFLWSGLATAAILIFFLVSLRNINSKIRYAEQALEENRKTVETLFQESVSSRIQSNITVLLRSQAAKSADVLTGLTETASADQEPAVFGGDIRKLFQHLSSALRNMSQQPEKNATSGQ